MTSKELFVRFIGDFVAKDKRGRWEEMVEKPLVLYKNINKLERYLNEHCVRADQFKLSILENFVLKFKPVWVWDFFSENTMRVSSLSQLVDGLNINSSFLVVSEKSRSAMYFNGDQDCWVCQAENQKIQ